MTDVVIVGAKRTAIGSFLGQFTGVATWWYSVSCSESMTRRISWKLRPVLAGYVIMARTFLSGSMMNTLVKDDRVVVSKLTPSLFEVRRGDIVVFEDPGGWLPPDHTLPESSGLSRVLTWVGVLPEDEGNHLIKRVIGVPGDKVSCCTADGRLMVNGTPIDEPYLFPGAPPSSRTFDITVPADHLWVMGDNRDHSQDSRFKDAPANDGSDGSIPISGVVGRSFAIIWPLSRATWLNGGGEAFVNVPAPAAGAMSATETSSGVAVMSGRPGPSATIGTLSK